MFQVRKSSLMGKLTLYPIDFLTNEMDILLVALIHFYRRAYATIP